jgi:7-cyano-7-deazaguanine synthase in queuosine biosynthesis
MITVAVHHNPTLLPKLSEEVIPVQIYGIDGRKKANIATIGKPVIDKVQRLGIQIPPTEFDFMTLALAVTSADTFVLRKMASDGWTRNIKLKIPLYQPEIWINQKEKLEEALHFLSGDLWSLEITEGGYEPPIPYFKDSKYRLTNLIKRECVCLFSGGLDSAIGVIDLIENNHSPLLISHAYKGDKSHQDSIAKEFLGEFSQFSVNANPISANGKTDVTMRTRSLNFLAFGAIGASAIAKENQLVNVPLYVPENGFISLNAPLTARRIGSLSTRTTHPYFLNLIQSIFDSVKIKTTIINPYQFKTKGEMLKECKNQELLNKIVSSTVSCSKWKRKRKQCGKCIPCLIRRSALIYAGIKESTSYLNPDLSHIKNDIKNRDDLFALMIAIQKLSTKNINSWISDSGLITLEPLELEKYKQVFIRGIKEVENFFENERII